MQQSGSNSAHNSTKDELPHGGGCYFLSFHNPLGANLTPLCRCDVQQLETFRSFYIIFWDKSEQSAIMRLVQEMLVNGAEVMRWRHKELCTAKQARLRPPFSPAAMVHQSSWSLKTNFRPSREMRCRLKSTCRSPADAAKRLRWSRLPGANVCIPNVTMLAKTQTPE